jgi:DNA-binding MarR family transcriptional regulator
MFYLFQLRYSQVRVISNYSLEAFVNKNEQSVNLFNGTTMKLDLDTFLAYQLINVASLVSSDLAKVYQAKFDLTIPQWRILANLAQFGQSNAKNLCEQANMDKSTVSRAIKILVEKKLLITQINSEDKRAAILSLSESGKELYKKIVPEALKWEKELLASLNTHEQSLLVSVLNKLKNNLQA